MRPLLVLALLLGACGPEEIIEDQRITDLTAGDLQPAPQTSSGAADDETFAYVQRGIALIQQSQCPQAMSEGFEPALAIFARRHAGEGVPRASRSASSGAADGASMGPAWSDTMYLQAFCMVEVGRHEEAQALLERALQMIPHDVVYACELGHIRQGQSRLDEALALFQGALENVRALRQNGALGGTQLFAQDLGWWERRALRGIGFTEYERGNLDQAEAAYRAALAIDPNDQRALEEIQLIATRRGAI